MSASAGETAPGDIKVRFELVQRFDDQAMQPIVEQSAEAICQEVRQHLQQSPDYFQSSDLTLAVRQFEAGELSCNIDVELSGSLNGQPFSHAWTRQQNSGDVAMATANPLVYGLGKAVTALGGKSAARREQRSGQRKIRGAVAIDLLDALDVAVRRPVSKPAFTWARVKRTAWILFAVSWVVAAVLAFMAFRRGEDASLFRLLVVSVVGGFVASLPAPVACLFIGPLFMPAEFFEKDAAGKRIKSLIGGKTVFQLRLASIIGGMLCLAAACGAFAGLVYLVIADD